MHTFSRKDNRSPTSHSGGSPHVNAIHGTAGWTDPNSPAHVTTGDYGHVNVNVLGQTEMRASSSENDFHSATGTGYQQYDNMEMRPLPVISPSQITINKPSSSAQSNRRHISIPSRQVS